eukprot:363923_1
MITITESDDYHSTTELECFMQDAHDSDCEIKLFDRDGKVLSGIAEHDMNVSESSDNEPIGYDDFFADHPTANASNLYYALENYPVRKKSGNKRAKLKYLINSIHKMCDAPHLYIQQRAITNSCMQNVINYILFLDQYLSYKYFYEISLPFAMELILMFGVFIFRPICVVLFLIIYCIIFKQISFCIFTFIASLTSFILFQLLSYLKILPFRALPNVIHNIDEYGFNIKRALNLRYLCRKTMLNQSSFPCYNTSNVTIMCLSFYLYTNEPLIFLWIPYVIIARCYFAYTYLMDCVVSLLVAVCIVSILYALLPSSSIIIVDEIIRETATTIFS